jgi:hypothetical protein
MDMPRDKTFPSFLPRDISFTFILSNMPHYNT